MDANLVIELQDLEAVQTKGRPSNKRLMPVAESIKINKKDAIEPKKQKYECSNCEESGHNIATCLSKRHSTVESTTNETIQASTKQTEMKGRLSLKNEPYYGLLF